jgi:lipopolysaccharide transport system ATP-binding protein
VWEDDEVPESAFPFKPLAVRVLNPQGQIKDTLRSTEPVKIEIEYELKQAISGLRVGLYLMTVRGEYILTSFDTDDSGLFESHTIRQPGRYTSRCIVPPDFLNEGRYSLGINASAYRVKRYFQDDQAITFNVDAAGAPGMQWPEPRLGPVRPRFDWKIEAE